MKTPQEQIEGYLDMAESAYRDGKEEEAQNYVRAARDIEEHGELSDATAIALLRYLARPSGPLGRVSPGLKAEFEAWLADVEARGGWPRVTH